ncbi:unnamed protein product [Amoebophrya sp. A25]|nr:unnamed protein product [Amoebophrya sp. A25]|eukprot:GSA25T00014109001.1
MMTVKRNSYSTPRGGGEARLDKAEKNRLLTDRAAYLNFLEVQLERVSSSCLTVQGFSERIEQVQTQVNGMEEKVLNCGRLIKLMQQYNEEVNRVAENIKVRVNEMNEDIEVRTNEKLEQLLQKVESSLSSQLGEHGSLLAEQRQDHDEHLGALREDVEKYRNLVEMVDAENKGLQKQAGEQYDMIKASEKLCNRLADDAVGLIESNDRRSTDFLDQLKSRLDAQLQDVHDRISRQREEATQHVMEMVEKRLNVHFAEQLGKMSDVLKKVVTNQRTLQQKVSAMESHMEMISFQVDKKPRSLTSRATSVSPKRRGSSPLSTTNRPMRSPPNRSPTFGSATDQLISPTDVDAAFRSLTITPPVQQQLFGSSGDSRGGVASASSMTATGNTLVPSTEMPGLSKGAPSGSPNSFSPMIGGSGTPAKNSPLLGPRQHPEISSSSSRGGPAAVPRLVQSKDDILNFDAAFSIPGVGTFGPATTQQRLRSRAGSANSDRYSDRPPKRRGPTIGPASRGNKGPASTASSVQASSGTGKLQNRISRRQAMEDLYRELRRLQNEELLDGS